MWKPLAVICPHGAGHEIFEKRRPCNRDVRKPEVDKSPRPAVYCSRLALAKKFTGMLPLPTCHASAHGGFEAHVRKSDVAQGY
jgi:hypothetical protein